MMSVSAHEDRRGEGAFSSELGWLVGWLAAQSAKSKGEGTVYSRTDHEGPEREKRYSSTVSLTSALDGVGGQRHAPAALPPGKIRHPFYTRLGGPQGRSGPVRNISPPPGFDPRTVQPVASRYTYRGTPSLLVLQVSCLPPVPVLRLRHVLARYSAGEGRREVANLAPEFGCYH